MQPTSVSFLFLFIFCSCFCFFFCVSFFSSPLFVFGNYFGLLLARGRENFSKRGTVKLEFGLSLFLFLFFCLFVSDRIVWTGSRIAYSCFPFLVCFCFPSFFWKERCEQTRGFLFFPPFLFLDREGFCFFPFYVSEERGRVRERCGRAGGWWSTDFCFDQTLHLCCKDWN